ncbi:hypothetical protein B0H63DRAFT_405695 [Podospora didyma]|uniref:Uncharacterized protein n=1 Tax=Podospora didyma TaxID=330526 RepID=A0AAE0U6G6_9PEZI|nr:hypothetical protein B0H63DRAFT_405695 [Podospora didyma]
MPHRTTEPLRPHPKMPWGTVVLCGAGAGFLGVAAMTASEKIEQFFTGRANSYVPARTLARLIGVTVRSGPGDNDSSLWRLNMAMHYGQGIVVGVARSIMGYNGITGPFADVMFAGLRLAVDQTLENWTGVKALPWTWPFGEQVIDLVHKFVYAIATGYFSDLWMY